MATLPILRPRLNIKLPPPFHPFHSFPVSALFQPLLPAAKLFVAVVSEELYLMVMLVSVFFLRRSSI